VNIIESGAEQMIAELDLSASVRTVVTALSELLGDGVGGMDLAALAGKMRSEEGPGALLGSWLGDGENSAISTDTLLSLLGPSKVARFAAKIGTNSSDATGALAKVVPGLMDQASSAGNLLDSVGGMGGLLGSAKSFLT
jgi:uncharacterized protein YidB (DUF937 family)